MINDVYPQIPERDRTFTIRKPYFRTRSVLSFEGVESVTDTSFGNDTDVNKIIARCKRTGEPLPQGEVQPQYSDCTNLQKDLTVLIDEAKRALDHYQQQERDQASEVARQQAENAQKAQQFDELQKKQAEIMKPAQPE